MNFNEICNLHKTDKGDAYPKGNCYADFYDPWFSKIKNDKIFVCEIGVQDGDSLRAYKEYFLNSYIWGLDIEDKTFCEEERIETRILDQSDADQLDNFVKYCKDSDILFDIILDDGSHDVEHQQITFGKFFQLVKPGGIYIIEDLGSSYFTLGNNLYGYIQTQTKINNNTIKFLNQRPFSSIWISEKNIKYINNNVDGVSTFDKYNENLPYIKSFQCENSYPIRSITSVIKKK